jgi:RimJ/RimL family protein N-acetyltransferase
VRESNDGRDEHRELALADGTCVLVREIRPEDAPALQRLVGRLSEHTIRLRYFGPMKELSNEKARYFAEVDGTDRYALAALDPEDEQEIVAVVRYDREDGTDRAEYAALVEDRFQGRGLGLGLTRALIEAARERDVRDFEALVLPENRGMLRLLRDLDLPERVRWEDGVKHFSIDLFPEKAS